MSMDDTHIYLAYHQRYSRSCECMIHVEETELRMQPENIHEFMRWEEVDQTIVTIFLRLLHGYMMDHDITTVRLLCLESMAYVVEYGDATI